MINKRLNNPKSSSIFFTLPAIAGVQAGREYFVAMCPLSLVPRLFPLQNDSLPQELDLQRVLHRGRVPEITRYLLRHPKTYILSSLTASVDADVEFDCIPSTHGAPVLGNLSIPMTAVLLLHDGLHRRAAIEAAIRANPSLGQDTISLVLFVDKGLRRSAQMFTDLKRHEAHSARSRSILNDDRDELARLVKALLIRVPVFSGLTEMARSTISNRSTKLFTFSGLYHSTVILLSDLKQEPFGIRLEVAGDFWREVAKHIPDWTKASERSVTTAELRSRCVHARALALASLAQVGKTLLASHPSSWRRKLRPLATLDWSRSNARQWEGRAMIGGRISKTRTSIILTANVIKRHIGLPLSPEDDEVENRLQASR